MSWCHNVHKKLRLFCLNRVSEIRTLIEGTIGTFEELPLYHIDGKMNVADLLTKSHSITPRDLGIGSIWQDGKPWMLQGLCDIPITKFSDLSVTKEDEQLINIECFPEILPAKKMSTVSSHHIIANVDKESAHCPGCCSTLSRIPTERCYGMQDVYTHCTECTCTVQLSCFRLEARKGLQMLIDIIKWGWLRSLRILSTSIKFIWFTIHKVHKTRGEKSPSLVRCAKPFRKRKESQRKWIRL